MWPFLSKQPRLSVTFPCTHNRKRKFNTTEGTMCIPTANIIKQRHNYSNTNRPPKEHSPAAYTSGDTNNNKTIGIQMEHNDAQHKCIQVQHRRSFDDLCVAANRPRWCLGSDGGEYKQKVTACSVAAASVPSVDPLSCY